MLRIIDSQVYLKKKKEILIIKRIRYNHYVKKKNANIFMPKLKLYIVVHMYIVHRPYYFQTNNAH